ncbi:MAG TPA: cellulase family glycosylhydrolase [Candidatus Saccharicenans sp.]|nr:cellulase family glycosylhydrolase [Candidatus Saccharicenans sp.]HRD02852.1 cellulase family glycosylhydrolase [Candidatus Saccharicenans sp.]
MKKGIRKLTVLFVLCLSSCLLANSYGTEVKEGQDSVSAGRYRHFLRGINLPYWFWLNQSEVQPLEKRFSSADLKLIKSLGLTFVRIPVDMANLYDPGREDKLNPSALQILLSGIAKILKSGLAVNFDLHSISQESGGSNYSGPLGQDEKFTAEFINFWQHLAEKLAIFDPDRLLIEPMNEPVFLGEEYKWPPIQKELLQAIREKLPEHTLLATGAFWSNLPGLLALEPVDDPNVWYNFHFYEPHIFTHQGATWGADYDKYLRHVPYPSSPESVEQAILLVENDTLKQYLRDYGEQGWKGQKIEAEILKAVAWAEKYGVRLLCNEFGAYRDYCLPPFRQAWIRDVRLALEKYQIGWAMWEFDGSFGLVFRENGRAVVDKDIVSALGLKLR